MSMTLVTALRSVTLAAAVVNVDPTVILMGAYACLVDGLIRK